MQRARNANTSHSSSFAFALDLDLRWLMQMLTVMLSNPGVLTRARPSASDFPRNPTIHSPCPPILGVSPLSSSFSASALGAAVAFAAAFASFLARFFCFLLSSFSIFFLS